MIYGYARVSLESQSLDLQLEALKKFDCHRVYSEKISSRKKDRAELKKLLKKLKSGDSLVCYKLDRLGRSLKELVNLITHFEERNIHFVSISDSIDTNSSSSKLLIHILMCIADYEREMVRERTIAGLAAAKKRGVKLGRPVGLNSEGKILKKKVTALFERGISPTEISRVLPITRPTVYKYLKV